MSLDNTLHPGMPGGQPAGSVALCVAGRRDRGAGDQRWRAGAARRDDLADLAAWLDDMFLPPDMLEWPMNIVVVRSGGRTMLIDAGIGDEYPDFPRAGRLALRLEAAGIDPASVTDVALTPMHMDHVGGLLADGLRGRLRPDVLVHLAAAEVEFWASPDFSRTCRSGRRPPALCGLTMDRPKLRLPL